MQTKVNAITFANYSHTSKQNNTQPSQPATSPIKPDSVAFGERVRTKIPLAQQIANVILSGQKDALVFIKNGGIINKTSLDFLGKRSSIPTKVQIKFAQTRNGLKSQIATSVEFSTKSKNGLVKQFEAFLDGGILNVVKKTSRRPNQKLEGIETAKIDVLSGKPLEYVSESRTTDWNIDNIDCKTEEAANRTETLLNEIITSSKKQTEVKQRRLNQYLNVQA